MTSRRAEAPAAASRGSGHWSRRTWLVALSVLALTACGRDTTPSQAELDARGMNRLWQLELPDLDEQPRALAQWQGQPVLLNFWATWCAPCVHEMPDLDALQTEFPQVRFLGLGIDSLDNMREFQRRIPVAYPLLGARPEGLELMRELGNASGGLPFTVLIDREGRLRHRVAGQIQPDALRQEILQIAG